MKIKFAFIGLLILNMLIAQEIKYEDLLNKKWLLSNYIIGSRELPIEKKRKKDYYIFDLHIPAIFKLIILILSTLGGSLLIYHFLLSRVGTIGILFGIHGAKND